MQFLKTLFWVLLAVLGSLFAYRNWFDVSLSLWGDIQADIKLPLLLLVAGLVGWLPTFLVYRARLWGLRRRLLVAEHPPVRAADYPPAYDPAAEEQPAQ